jgi:hypothetical protein
MGIMLSIRALTLPTLARLPIAHSTRLPIMATPELGLAVDRLLRAASPSCSPARI